MSFVIGIDGGGSHTRAVILDERGSEVGRAEATGEVVTERAPGLAADAVAAAARQAARGAGLALPGAVLWAGLAGAGSEAARRAVAREIEAAGLAGRVRVGTDVEAAFHAAFPEGPGILLIAGTGSIAWGRSPSGASVRVGGWGRLLGDEGSAFALGMGALRAVARAEDGRAAATTLREGVLGTLGIEAAGALIAWAAGASKAEVAALAAVVTRAAAAGDATASELVERAVSDLAAHVAAVLARLGPWPQLPEVVLWGGLIARDGPLRAALERRLSAHSLEVRAADPDPALGAAGLALEVLRSPAP